MKKWLPWILLAVVAFIAFRRSKGAPVVTAGPDERPGDAVPIPYRDATAAPGTANQVPSRAATWAPPTFGAGAAIDVTGRPS